MFIKTTLMAGLSLMVLPLAACSNEGTPPQSAPESPAIAAPETPAPPVAPTASAAVADSPQSCLSERGKVAADRLVERCLAVSGATRPPCNVQNPCAMMENEITRNCDSWPADGTKPAECAA
ncbi:MULTISPECIES: hypothetical protein [unclassified Brevundimonas]|uniref:hypothetical protein n=1 Tax=unclassified Brevundimonas TaxID=2622653 RepID=UPI0025B882BA|nr:MULTISPECIES: hypothetical protein [unclassified Brevundimonas]